MSGASIRIGLVAIGMTATVVVTTEIPAWADMLGTGNVAKVKQIGQARQTPKMDFGDRMKAGLDTAAGLVGGNQSTSGVLRQRSAEGKNADVRDEAAQQSTMNRLTSTQNLLSHLSSGSPAFWGLSSNRGQTLSAVSER